MSKIGWCDLTLNPITGCKNGCEYCYARNIYHRFHRSFEPEFHPERLDRILSSRGKGKRIFLDSASDWFSPGVNPEWVKSCLLTIGKKPEHTFMVLTKRPDNIGHIWTLPNMWWGVSVTYQGDLWRIKKLKERLPREANLFVSFEPLHGSIDADLTGVSWVIIGAESGNRKGKIIPKMEWVESIFQSLPDGVPIFMKDNLGPELMPAGGFIQQFPEAML